MSNGVVYILLKATSIVLSVVGVLAFPLFVGLMFYMRG
jgi:hypothetical protein